MIHLHSLLKFSITHESATSVFLRLIADPERAVSRGNHASTLRLQLSTNSMTAS